MKVIAIQLIDSINLVKKVGYNAKIVAIQKKIPNHNKYITPDDFNKCSGAIFDERLFYQK